MTARRFPLLQKFPVAFFRAEEIFFAVYDFSDGVLLGKVDIARLIFDHSAGELLRRARGSCPALRREEKADDNIDNIGNENIKDEFKKTLNHLLNVPDLTIPVKH
jgi:hypothetical protein